jgi:hypothetical protein
METGLVLRYRWLEIGGSPDDLTPGAKLFDSVGDTK